MYRLITLLMTLPCFAMAPFELKNFGNGRIECYDTNDVAFDREGVPFLVMQNDEILELGKTENFTGKEIISIAKSLQQSTLTLTDTSLTLPCECDGKWCCNEALMDLKMTGIFIHGKTYYESLGATSIETDFRECARFIYHTDVSDFLFELDSLWQYPQAKKMSALIKKICKTLQLTLPDLTIGKLSYRLYNASKTDETAHKLWHLYHDHIIAEKDSFLTEYIYDACKSRSLPESTLVQLLAIVKKEIDEVIQLGFSFDEECLDYRLCHFQRRLETNAHMPAFFMLSRASNECLKKTVKVKYTIRNSTHLEDLYRVACQQNTHSRFTLSNKLFTNWILAKSYIRKSRQFQFL